MRKYKSMKVFLDGARLKDVYPYATKWEVRKYKCMKFIRELFKKLFIALMIGLGSVILFLYFYPNRVIVTKVTTDTLTPKVEEIKKEAIDKLKDCESSGYSEDDGIIIFDPHATNKKVEAPSLGQFQFKKATVIHYYKTLYNKVITGKEAVIIALDTDKAEKLATDIIFTTDKGYTNWINCSNKIGLKITVDMVNKLK